MTDNIELELPPLTSAADIDAWLEVRSGDEIIAGIKALLRARQAPAPVEVSRLAEQAINEIELLARACSLDDPEAFYAEVHPDAINAAERAAKRLRDHLASMASTPVGEVPAGLSVDHAMQALSRAMEKAELMGGDRAELLFHFKQHILAASPAPAASKGAEAVYDFLMARKRAIYDAQKDPATGLVGVGPHRSAMLAYSQVMDDLASIITPTCATPSQPDAQNVQAAAPSEPEAQKAVAWQSEDMPPSESGWFVVRRADGTLCPRAFNHGDWWIPLKDGWMSGIPTGFSWFGPFAPVEWDTPVAPSPAASTDGLNFDDSKPVCEYVPPAPLQWDDEAPAASMEVQGLTSREVYEHLTFDERCRTSVKNVCDTLLAITRARALAAKNGWRLGEGL